jgi:hypothetical protein
VRKWLFFRTEKLCYVKLVPFYTTAVRVRHVIHMSQGIAPHRSRCEDHPTPETLSERSLTNIYPFLRSKTIYIVEALDKKEGVITFSNRAPKNNLCPCVADNYA